MNFEWQPLWLSLQLALITTVLLLTISVPLAWWLSETRKRIKPVIETIVSMPLVLPPTVLGFYLLIAFSPENFPGSLLEDWFGLQLIFSFGGLIIASLIYSLPFMVHPIQSGLENLPLSLRDAPLTLGKSKWQTMFRVLLPNIKRSLLTGIVLTFAHTIGEFGVVLMIGGNIPGETRVASIAIYDRVEALQYGTANTYALILFVLTFAILLTVYLVNNRNIKAQNL